MASGADADNGEDRAVTRGSRDLDEPAMRQLQQLATGRDAVLAAVAYAAERFLRGGGFARTVDDVLAALGEATGVDRTYVFTVEPEAGTWLSTQRYEWVAPGVEPQLDLELFQRFDMCAEGFRRWTELMPRGITISGATPDLPEPEREVLEQIDIGAIAVAPVQVRDRWWGWLAFETLEQRRWEATEIDALEAAAAVLGACLQQEEATELLRRNEQRAAEAYRRERMATERLRALDRLKDTFLTAVSHELRTPLTAITGFAETLSGRLEELEEAQIRDLLGRMRTNSDRLEALLGELLDLNRLREQALIAEPQPVYLVALVEEAVEAASIVLGERRTHVEVDDDVASIHTDPVLLGRVLSNLLENVGRHTPMDATVWLRVEGAGADVMVSVIDNGPGVPSAWKRRIFEPFQHGPVVDESQPGTGIGLNLVTRFVSLLGGQVWVEDRDGGGAAFHVRLPRTGPSRPGRAGVDTVDPRDGREGREGRDGRGPDGR